MKESLRALLHGLIDYAGLFPPASLPLGPALANYARYRREPEQWLLGRFILPAGQLAALNDELMAWFTPEQPLPLALLYASGSADKLAWDAARVRYGERLRLEALEMRLPAEGKAAAFLAASREALDSAEFSSLPIFHELPFNAAWDARLEPAIAALAEHQAQRGAPTGFKLRCGGLTPETVPTATQVARVLALCRDYGLPLKATAGLHHPLPRYDPAVGTTLHGFLNLFGGGLLAHSCRLSQADLATLLMEENPARFRLTDVTFGWGQWQVTLAQIETLRRTALIAYGSCSFDEPRDDLRGLGWL